MQTTPLISRGELEKLKEAIDLMNEVYIEMTGLAISRLNAQSMEEFSLALEQMGDASLDIGEVLKGLNVKKHILSPGSRNHFRSLDSATLTPFDIPN